MAKHNGLSEDELCLRFAEAVKESSDFRAFVLSKTKFAPHARTARLLHEEQMALRPRKFWWRHWWCHVPELERDRETDIFMVFEIEDGLRFALHVENKLGTGKFEDGQPEAYGPRARHMSNNPDYLSYGDFETLLVGTQAFCERNSDSARHFDRTVTFEAITPFIPEFAVASGARW